MTLRKVISGAQTGADIAGLMAAKACGLETGGWMPHGCKTSEGAHVDWLGRYGLLEHEGGYAERTYANVRDSDATLRLAFDFTSPGEVCTAKAIEHYCKPSLDVDMNDPQDPENVRFWLDSIGVEVLNIAGNTERISNPIQVKVYEYLLKVFKGPLLLHADR